MELNSLEVMAVVVLVAIMEGVVMALQMAGEGVDPHMSINPLQP